MIYINLYGIFIIAFAICLTLFRIPITNDFIKNLLSSENITEVFKSTITCISILIGFLGTLISQINSLNNKEKTTSSKVPLFFSLADDKTISGTISACILSGVTVIILSLFLLTSDVMTESIKNHIVYFWLYFFIVFLYYDFSVYHVFISLIFSKNVNNNPLQCSDTNEDITKCMESLEETHKH